MQIAKCLRPVVLGLILCASHARTFSMLNGYSAPLEIYKHFEHHEDVGSGENHYFFTIFGMNYQMVLKSVTNFSEDLWKVSNDRQYFFIMNLFGVW